MKTSRRRTVALMLAGSTALSGAAITVAAGTGDEEYSATLAAKIDPAKPKNVILLVGDGMGDSEVTLARYYGKGARGRLNMDRLPFRGSSIHYVLRPGPGPNYLPNYVGDSAPTATAWSTGKKTQDNRLSQGPSSADTVPGSNAGYRTYLEIARDRGKATGNVTTADITDATPAGPSAHISQRSCQGPNDTRTTCPSEAKTANPPGLGSVAEQQVDEGFDLYLGGGRSQYQEKLVAGGNDDVIGYAQSKGYKVLGTKTELAAQNTLESGGVRNKLIGLFNPSNMVTEYKPLFARPKAFRDANPNADAQVNGGSDTTRCQIQDRGTEPSLTEMTNKALQILSQDPDGFSLQVEGASIDKRDHAADICGQIGETLAFDDAVGAALDFQADNPDTLIIVTADHAHSSQMINSGATPAVGSSYGTVQTVDGAPIRVSYGTADTGLDLAGTTGSQAHTGATVPVWAAGPQAANIQGTIDETDIFRVLNGLTPSKLGAVGAAGPAGAPGAPGAPGADGAPGTNGTNGTNGAPGTNGTNGAAGTNGTNGTNGGNGPTGASGTSGANGTNGAPGANGSNGANGSTGPQGGQGPAGRDGAVVVCVTSRKGNVSCKVQSGRTAKTARLLRKGKTVSRARVAHRRMTFGKLAKGRYTVAVGRSRTSIRVK